MKKKGEFGYIKSRRKLSIAVSILMLAMVLVIYFVARWYFGTNKNLFTILAALGCLPLGKCVVNMIMFHRAKPCSEQVRSRINQHIGDLPGAWDLYMTSYSKNFQLSHITKAGKNVCAFTETAACDGRAGEEHIKKMMENNGFHDYTVKIFFSLDKYLERLDQLNALAEGKTGSSEALFNLFRSISL